MKISEAGPTNQRIEALVLSDCLKSKISNNEIEQCDLILENGSNQVLYYLPGVDRRKLNPRVKKIKEALEIYTSTTQMTELCGNVLEYIIGQSIIKSKQYITLLPLFENKDDGVFKIPNTTPDMLSFDGKVIYNNAPLDGILIHKDTSIPVGIEIKNKREWKYPPDVEIWITIAKCVSIEVLPVFVARKIPEITKFFFKKAGILGLETQFQFIHPCKETEFKNVIDKNYLGYSDIKLSVDTRSNLDKFFVENIPNNIEEYYETFMQNKNLLFKYATQYRLADKSYNKTPRTHSYMAVNDLLGI
jgi:hypothetical protein